ncbi:MAG: SufD family Fe-S cluster assembly protein [Lachnospiraceae bacterium]|nr:SufD family Fe-S cluster assembly protein [Lachnospiraceae bacterium]
MEAKQMIINQLPVRTWNHLKMNEAVVKDAAFVKKGTVEVFPTAGLQVESTSSVDFSTIPTGAGKDMDLAATAADPEGITIYSKKEQAEEDFVRLVYTYEEDGNAMNTLRLETADDATLTVYVEMKAKEGITGKGALSIKAKLGKESCLRLITVQKSEEGFELFNDIGGATEEKAKFEVCQLILGNGDQYNGCDVELHGEASETEINVGYAKAGKSRLDMNYIARHYGPLTISNITASGSLRDQSFKLFRGTLDFVRGAKEASGAEAEDVFLIDDGVINQTIPLILCGEENVAGAHGATIGKPDDDTVFYLKSRGIPEAEAIELLAQAKLQAVVHKIPHKALRREYEILTGGFVDEEE